DLGLGRWLVRSRAAARAGGAGRPGASGARRRTRVQRRIADSLGRTGGTLLAGGLFWFPRLRAIAAAQGLFTRRTAAKGGTLQRRAAGRDPRRALAEIDRRTLGRRRLGRFGLGFDLGGFGLHRLG